MVKKSSSFFVLIVLVEFALALFALFLLGGPSQDKKVSDIIHSQQTTRSNVAGFDFPERPVVVLGLDGATWDVILPLIDRGELKNLKRLMDEGAYGTLMSQHPLSSPVIWTTIATGQPREKHGITEFVISDHPVRSTDRKVKAAWNIASDCGLRVGLVSYLATWPAEEVNGFVLSNRIWAHSEPSITYPPELAPKPEEFWLWYSQPEERINKLRRFINYDFKPDYKSLLDENSREYMWNFLIKTYLFGHMRYCEARTRLGLRLFNEYRPHLYMAHHFAIDRASHGFWKFMQPGGFEDVNKEEIEMFGKAIENYYIYLDEIVGRYIEELPEDATFVILSDHGFGPALGEFKPLPGKEYVSGNHRLEGILILKGEPIRQGARLEGVDIFDIAPTLLYLLDLPVPDKMIGHPPMQVFTENYKSRHPFRVIEEYQQERALIKEGPKSGVDEDVIEELKALGYLQ